MLIIICNYTQYLRKVLFQTLFRHYTSTTSVRAYLIQVLEAFDCTSISKTGVGGRPCPSHNKLSQANDISHIGTSAGSEKTNST